MALTNSQRTEYRMLRELNALVRAAAAEVDLHTRLDGLNRIADIIESVCRICPELDAAFWTTWISKYIDECHEQIADFYDE